MDCVSGCCFNGTCCDQGKCGYWNTPLLGMITVCLIIVVSLVVGAIVIRRVMQEQEQEAKEIEEDIIVRDLNY